MHGDGEWVRNGMGMQNWPGMTAWKTSPVASSLVQHPSEKLSSEIRNLRKINPVASSPAQTPSGNTPWKFQFGEKQALPVVLWRKHLQGTLLRNRNWAPWALWSQFQPRFRGPSGPLPLGPSPFGPLGPWGRVPGPGPFNIF